MNFNVSGHNAAEEPNSSNINANSLVSVCAVKHEWLYDSLHNCSAFNNLTFDQFIANGGTKVVHRAKTANGKHVVISDLKSIPPDIKLSPRICNHIVFRSQCYIYLDLRSRF